jgi:hypothetical protein
VSSEKLHSRRRHLTDADTRRRPRCCAPRSEQLTASDLRRRFSLHSLGLVVFATGLAVALPSSAAAASVPCWQRVILDWSKHGSITGTYPASCLRQTMQNEPTDLRIYSTLDDNLQQALTRKPPAARQLAVASAPIASLNATGGSPSQTLLILLIASIGATMVAAAAATGRVRPRATRPGPSARPAETDVPRPRNPPNRRATRPDQATIKLAATAGFLVTDRDGKPVGRVESPMYETTPDEPDALAVKAGLFRRNLVMANTIDSIDSAARVIGLNVEHNSIPTFL